MSAGARVWWATLAIVIGLVGGAAAKEGAEEEAAARDPSHVAAKEAIDARRYQEAVRVLGAALARDHQNAETHNLLGFAYRKMGDLEQAFRHYREALRLNPEHRGAHEYIGEAYLAAGDLAKAEEHLRRLERLCQSPCDEQVDLKAAIDAYKAKRQTGGAPRSTR